MASGKLAENRERPDAHYSWVWYDAEEVALLAKRHKFRRASRTAAERRAALENARGETAAKAFALFAQGKTDVEVVIAGKLDPALVAQLRDEWVLLQNPELRRARQLREKAEAEQREQERFAASEVRKERWRQYRIKMAKLGSERKSA